MTWDLVGPVLVGFAICSLIATVAVCIWEMRASRANETAERKKRQQKDEELFIMMSSSS